MGVVADRRLDACDGFRVESPRGHVGWVEEVWLGRPGEPSAVALRTSAGRRALVTEDDVVAVLPDDSMLVVGADAVLLELGPPRLEQRPEGQGSRARLSASWSTTGTRLELPAPGRLRGAVLARRPRRRRRPRSEHPERPLWALVVGLYLGLAAIIVVVIALAFVVARVATGSAY